MASAYVSKSKKGLQPKAPVRRSVVPGSASSQVSVRNSVDRQTQPNVPEPTSQLPRVVASLADVSHGAVVVLASPTTQSQSGTTNVEATKDLAKSLAGTSTDADSQLKLQQLVAEQEQPVSLLIPECRSTPLESDAINSALTPDPTLHQTIAPSAPFEQPSQTVNQSRHSPEQVHDPPCTRQFTQNLSSEQAPQLSEDRRQARRLTRHTPVATCQPTTHKRSHKTTEIPRHPKRARYSSRQADDSSNETQGQSSENVGRDSSGQLCSTDQRTSTQNEDTGEGIVAAKGRKAGGRVKSTTQNQDEVTALSKKGKRRKTKARGQVTSGKRKSQMSPTPEDAEHVTIEEDIMRMEELCSERRTGKKSVRSGEILVFEAAEAERRAAAKARRLAGEEPLESENRATPAGADQEDEGSTLAPQTQIVNGEIVLIEESTRIDRHAMADAQREADAVVVVEENGLTTRVNSHYNLKKTPNQRWTDEDTEEFYNALKMFGTDFEIISKMFPTRSRRAVKLKYTHEEKVNQTRISQTLHGERIPVNIEEFSEWTETTYADPAILHAEMETDRRVLEEEQAKEKEFMEEARRQREAETAAEAAAVDADASAKENEEHDHTGTAAKVGKMAKRGQAKTPKVGKTTKRGRKLPNIGGGQVEVLGRIEDNVHHQPKVPTL